jgi:hypothetical protein
MKVDRILSRKDENYPYKFRIDYSEKNIGINEIYNWVLTSKIKCTHIPGVLYVTNESDAIFFILSFS